MKSSRHERTRARRTALQVLYSGELTEQSPTAILDNELALEDEDGLLNQYARSLVMGTESHSAQINKLLSETSENWSVDRMPIVDRCILRIAVFEMLYADAVPTAVCINEAVDLAKSFGGEDESARFVNGVLGKVAKLIDGSAADEAASAAEEA